MQNATQQTVEWFLNAVKNGDRETIISLLHPEVKWTQPGENRFSGEKNSAAEVFAMSAGWQEVSEGTFRLTNFTPVGVNGDEVACMLHFKATHPGAGLEIDNIDVYTVKDNQIVEARIFSLDQRAEDAFWGK